MTYRELQTALREYKEAGRTDIRLNSSELELRAEFSRLQQADAEAMAIVMENESDTPVGHEAIVMENESDTPVGHEAIVMDEPAQPEILPKLWLKMLKKMPGRVTAALFRQKSTLHNIVTHSEFRDGKFQRPATTLVVTTDTPNLRELLRRKAFLLESAYFSLTGIPASVRIEIASPCAA